MAEPPHPIEPSLDPHRQTTPRLSAATPGSATKPPGPTRPAAVPVRLSLHKRRKDLTGLFLQHDWTIGLLYLVLDAVVWLTFYNLSVFLRGSADYAVGDSTSSVFLLQLAVIALCLFIVGGYDRRTNFPSLGYMSEHLITLVAAGGLGALMIYSVTAYGQNIRPSRGVLISSLAAFSLLSLTYRRYIGTFLLARTAQDSFLVIGGGAIAQRFSQSYLKSGTVQKLRFVVPHFHSEDSQLPDEPMQTGHFPVLYVHSLAEVAALALESQAVIVAEEASNLPDTLLNWLSRLHFERTPVYTLENFYERYWRRVPVHAIDTMWPLRMRVGLAGNSVYSQVKRLFDMAIASVCLLLLSPLLALLVVSTWLDSGRPALFRQTRVGRDNNPFTIYKYRTMHNRPPGAEGDVYTRAGDARITRLGHWLRKLRLDELPQLWNVLKGDMSIMGPRAEWDLLARQYEEDIPFYRFRHLVRPGITGWAQVNYPYGASREDAVEKLKYDLYYIRHYSLRLDAMIILKTLHIMVWGKGT